MFTARFLFVKTVSKISRDIRLSINYTVIRIAILIYTVYEITLFLDDSKSKIRIGFFVQISMGYLYAHYEIVGIIRERNHEILKRCNARTTPNLFARKPESSLRDIRKDVNLGRRKFCAPETKWNLTSIYLARLKLIVGAEIPEKHVDNCNR